VPLLILTLYAFRLKGTPLAGNVMVSALVAYALLFGSLGAPHFTHLLIPAVLAMLLNFCREIIKDVQDAPGDRAAGISTTAVLGEKAVRRIIYGCSIVYFALLFVPALLGHFGIVYAGVVAATALPLSFLRLRKLHRPDWPTQCASISTLLKIEMLAGLLALAIDRLATYMIMA
jgi:geranylgeranylglycerol-phosphate geranylgeranyltransferase